MIPFVFGFITEDEKKERHRRLLHKPLWKESDPLTTPLLRVRPGGIRSNYFYISWFPKFLYSSNQFKITALPFAYILP